MKTDKKTEKREKIEIKENKKQRQERERNRKRKQESCAIAKMTARYILHTSASHVSSQSRTRVKLNRDFPTPPLVSTKFPHVPL